MYANVSAKEPYTSILSAFQVIVQKRPGEFTALLKSSPLKSAPIT